MKPTLIYGRSLRLSRSESARLRALIRATITCSSAILLLLSGFGLQLSAQKVKVDYEKSTDFSRYKTYAWVNGTPVFDPEMDAYITNRIIEALRLNGMTEANVRTADLIATYHAARNTDLVVGTALDPTYAASGGVPMSGHSMWETGAGGGTHVTKGSLTIEIIDRTANRPVWSGTAKHSVADKTDERWNLVHKALDKLLSRFPPEH